MSLFTVDYSKAKQFQDITDGTYEVVVDYAEQSATPAGADFLDIRLKIRDDFKQDFQGQNIFDRIYFGKETMKPVEFRLQQYAHAIEFPEGAIIETEEDFMKQIRGKALKVTVKNEDNEYQGKVTKRLNVKALEPSEMPDKIPSDEQVGLNLPF